MPANRFEGGRGIFRFGKEINVLGRRHTKKYVAQSMPQIDTARGKEPFRTETYFIWYLPAEESHKE
jgi:hypothetical protein